MSWRELLKNELEKNFFIEEKEEFHHPLIQNTYNEEEILSMVDVFVSDKLTMGKKVEMFEKEFAKYIGAKYALMVNSGSTANLISLAVATNPLRKNKLNPGDKIIIPNICWSTSVYPVIQCGLKPVFVDVEPGTLNIDLDKLEKIITPDVKGIVSVHILGNCCNMDRFMNIVNKHNLFLLEDTCESLGATYKNKRLGNFGDFGTYSFYYSHQITTIEGGMVVCNDYDDYQLLKCLRSHGWTRHLDNKEELEKLYENIDPRFIFVNLGYNFRPMENQGAMGLVQLKKLPTKNENRCYNYDAITNAIKNHEKFNGQITFVNVLNDTKPSWMGCPMFLNKKYKNKHRKFLEYLTSKNLENRPIISGNFVRQPVFKLLNIEGIHNPEFFEGGEYIHHLGFFIGLPCYKLSNKNIKKIVNIILEFDF